MLKQYFYINFVTIYVGNCYAIEGPGIGRDCQFTFVYNGKTYNKCAKSYPRGERWCRVKKLVNENFNSADNWGICNLSCLTYEGNCTTILSGLMIYRNNFSYLR